MDNIIALVFKYVKIDYDRLKAYGFIERDGELVYETSLIDGQMSLRIFARADGTIGSEVTDMETGEPFTLFLASDAVGAFLGQVRTEYEQVLADIAANCCEKQIFKSANAKAAIEYVRASYGDELEFLWEKSPDVAIWRRKDNRKWYGVIFSVSKRKLGVDSDDIVEIINVRVKPEELDELIDNDRYYIGYHMNKKHWIALSLEDTCDIDEIIARIDDSYALADKRKAHK